MELFCERLYEATDPAIRTEAEKSLVVFSNSPDCLQKCQVLLERATVSNRKQQFSFSFKRVDQLIGSF